MPVNPELVGREFPPTSSYLVGREKVREFARAVFADDPQHTDPAAAQALGYADVVAPPTFAIVVQELTLQQLLAEPDSGIVLQNVLHAEQRFAYTRPDRRGRRADRPALGHRHPHPRRQRDGHERVRDHGRLGRARRDRDVHPARGGGRRVTDLSVGDIVAERTIHLTRESLVRYAGRVG